MWEFLHVICMVVREENPFTILFCISLRIDPSTLVWQHWFKKINQYILERSYVKCVQGFHLAQWWKCFSMNHIVSLSFIVFFISKIFIPDWSQASHHLCTSYHNSPGPCERQNRRLLLRLQHPNLHDSEGKQISINMTCKQPFFLLHTAHIFICG